MDPNIIHLIVAGGLTLVCVVVTALIWRSAQVKTVFWWIGLTLLPMGLYLLGLGPAAAGAYETLTAWAGALEFSPLVWTGVTLASLSALLILGSRLIPSESLADRREARKAAATTTASKKPATGPAPSRPAVAAKPNTPPPSGATASDSEFDDIAELLRKRGIS